MIDYIKIFIQEVDADAIIDKLRPKFRNEFYEEKVKLIKSEVKYHHCTIKIHPNDSLEFKGSIHMLWNSINKTYPEHFKKSDIDKGYNGNQFNLNAIYDVQEHLKRLFQCELDDMIIQSIEFGTNIEMDLKPDTYVKGFLYHHGKLFEYKNNKNRSEVRHQRYHLKIYNKGKQYRLKHNILRTEIKIKKMISLMDAGIKTFADINPTTLGRATELLLLKIQECTFYDKTIDPKKVDKKLVKYLDLYKNQDYWIDDLKPHQRVRHKKRLSQITEKYSNQIFKDLILKIIEKSAIINQPTENQQCNIINTLNMELKNNNFINKYKEFFKEENNLIAGTQKTLDTYAVSDAVSEKEHPLTKTIEKGKRLFTSIIFKRLSY